MEDLVQGNLAQYPEAGGNGGRGMTIGEKIKNERLAAGLSRKKLAKLAGCTDTAVRFWETGQRMPKVKQLQGLADALGVDFMNFIEEGLKVAYKIEMHTINGKSTEIQVDTREHAEHFFKEIVESGDWDYVSVLETVEKEKPVMVWAGNHWPMTM